MKLSLVVPCYNEAENVAAFQDAVISAFSGCGYDYEIVFVNDGSTDATLHNLRKIHAAQKCPVQGISFSRNFGKESGLYAGLEHARGSSGLKLFGIWFRFWMKNRRLMWLRLIRTAVEKAGCSPFSREVFIP